MKKKLVSILLVAAMTATMVAGCGDSGESNQADSGTADATGDAAATETADAADATADATGGETVTLKWAIWVRAWRISSYMKALITPWAM